VVEITWVSPAGATRASRVRLDAAPAVLSRSLRGAEDGISAVEMPL